MIQLTSLLQCRLSHKNLWSAVLVVIDFLRCCLSLNVLIYPLVLKNSFAWQISLGWKLFCFKLEPFHSKLCWPSRSAVKITLWSSWMQLCSDRFRILFMVDLWDFDSDRSAGTSFLVIIWSSTCLFYLYAEFFPRTWKTFCYDFYKQMYPFCSYHSVNTSTTSPPYSLHISIIFPFFFFTFSTYLLRKTYLLLSTLVLSYCISGLESLACFLHLLV